MQLSIVVATHDRSGQCARMCAILEDQLRREPTLSAEIILVFDGCGRYEWVRDHQFFGTIELPRRLGIAAARNAGLAHAQSPVVAFLDDDALPADTWLSSLLRGLAAYPQHIAFGGRVIGQDSENLYARLRDLVYYFERFGAWYVNDDDGSDLSGPPYVNGGNGAYRRSALVSAGGFNPALPAYSDVEVGRRLDLRAHGMLLAGMSIRHDHPSTFAGYMERCVRSGRARALIWQEHRYDEHSSASVLRAILHNILWRNHVRAQRLNRQRVKAAAVLFCQEVAHGYGYAASLLKGEQIRRVPARRWPVRPQDGGDQPATPLRRLEYGSPVVDRDGRR
jgi:cellulose synthase/poly-beta-1,6-N-acetylglucosamine synthase-like glycosyltransferase